MNGGAGDVPPDKAREVKYDFGHISTHMALCIAN